MVSEIKMYMLVSGLAVVVTQFTNESEILWEYPIALVVSPRGLQFMPMNIPDICKTQNVFPNLDNVLYTMTPTDKIIDGYKSFVEDLKMRASGIVKAPNNKQIIMP